MIVETARETPLTGSDKVKSSNKINETVSLFGSLTWCEAEEECVLLSDWLIS